MLREIGLATIAIALSITAARAAEDNLLAACREETDSLKRLTCYDQIQIRQPRLAPGGGGTPSVSFVSADLRLQGEDMRNSIYSPRIELRPRFKNDSEKTVVALMHQFSVTDAFGDKILEQTDKLDIRIPPQQSATSEMFYIWEDNQFTSDEPFDNLVGPVGTGTAKASSTVLRVVYADGSTAEF